MCPRADAPPSNILLAGLSQDISVLAPGSTKETTQQPLGADAEPRESVVRDSGCSQHRGCWRSGGGAGEVSLWMLSPLHHHQPSRTADFSVLEMLLHGYTTSKRYQASPSGKTTGLCKGCQPAVGSQVLVSPFSPENLVSMVPCLYGQSITTPSQSRVKVFKAVL